MPPLDGASAITLFLPDELGLRLRRALRQPALAMMGLFAVWYGFGIVIRPVFGMVVRLVHPDFGEPRAATGARDASRALRSHRSTSTPRIRSQSIIESSATWVTTTAGLVQSDPSWPGNRKPCAKRIRYPRHPIIRNTPRILGK
jgi:hypothetical protein